MKRLFLYLFLYVCAGAGVFGQTNGDLRHVSIDEGLTGDCVYCILKDSRGLTWVGTNNGISLYDGQHAETVECDVRRSLNLVHDLVELADGSIVAAMRGGLFHVNRQTLTVRQVCPQLQDVRTLLVLGDSLLVGSGSGLTIVEPRAAWRVTPVTLGNSRMARDNRIADVCSDGQGGAWVMSASALYHLDGRLHITRTKADFSAVRDGLRCVCAVGNRVYIGTSWQGLLCYDRPTHRLQAVEEVADGVVADLHSDGNRLFVALDGGGAVVLDTRTDKVLRGYVHDGTPSGLPTNSVYTFWQDADDTAFFGFFRQGLAHSLRVNHKVEIFCEEGIDTRRLSMRSFCIHDPWVAIGTHEGLWLVDKTTGVAHHYNSADMGGSNVLSIAWFAEHFVVATFDGGLCTVNPHTGVVQRPTEDVLRKGNFTKVGPIPPSDTLLMAISDHIAIINNKFHIVATYNSRNSGLRGSVMTDFLFDRTGKAWLSSDNGLALYDPTNEVVQSDFPAGFFNREVAVRFALDRNGDVLAVSENGLYRSQPDLSRWDSIDIIGRLDVSSISFIAPEKANYWVGTDRGLFLMDSLFQRFRHYGLVDGLPSLFCNSQSWQHTPDDSFWFSTAKGLCRVKGEGFLNESSVPLYFSSVTISGRSLPLADCIHASEQKRLSAGWNFGQEEVVITVTPLYYADGRATYLEWRIDDGPMQVMTERRPIHIKGLWLGRHKMHVFMPGEVEAQTFVLGVWPSAAFWFEVVFVVLLGVSIPLLIMYQQRVKRYRMLRRRKRAIEKELYAREAVERHIQEEEQQRREAEEARRATMYQRSRSSQEEYRRLLRELKHLMEDERPYRQADLRVADVARALHTTPNKLSQMLSQHAEVTFYDFINDYRIEEFKRRALDEKFTHLSTLAIAEKCGFKKTTFYSAFAKKEGCTPAEWLIRQGKKR